MEPEAHNSAVGWHWNMHAHIHTHTHTHISLKTVHSQGFSSVELTLNNGMSIARIFTVNRGRVAIRLGFPLFQGLKLCLDGFIAFGKLSMDLDK